MRRTEKAVAFFFLLISLANTKKSYNPLPEGENYFLDNFQYETEELFDKRWQISRDVPYNGNWKIAAPADINIRGIRGDRGLVMSESEKNYGAYSLLDKPLSIKEQGVVIQYEVRFQAGITCGGAYMKLLSVTEGDRNPITNQTPYSIMFGPDKCDKTNKVHFIFNYKNSSNEYEEKHAKKVPKIKDDTLTHLYTLHIRTDNSFEMWIDLESVLKGSLLEDFDPPVNLPAEIDDPNDVMPADWNADEKGAWKPKKIPNPNHTEDKHPLTRVANIDAVGFELITNSKDIMFDNIIIGVDIVSITKYAENTWKVKYEKEKLLLKEKEVKDKKKPSKSRS